MSTVFLRMDTLQMLTLDVTQNISFSHSATPTNHPVSSGQAVTDHMQDQPDRFVVRGLVTGISTPTMENPIPGRVEIARDFLLSAKEDGARLTVQTQRYGSFDNCVIERLSYPVNQRIELRCDIHIRQIRIAEQSAVEIPPEAPAAAASSSMPDEQDAGQQATTTSQNTTQDEAYASTAYGLFN